MTRDEGQFIIGQRKFSSVDDLIRFDSFFYDFYKKNFLVIIQKIQYFQMVMKNYTSSGMGFYIFCIKVFVGYLEFYFEFQLNIKKFIALRVATSLSQKN